MESSHTQGHINEEVTWDFVKKPLVLEWVPQSNRVASAPQDAAEDRETWTWKTGPADLASGL